MGVDLMEKIFSLCKRRGFVFLSSEIYGGLANSWDYGPYGVELKNNIKRAWWKSIVYERDDIFGIDASIIMHPDVWKASGHTDNFFDLKSDCKSCKKRFKIEELNDKSKCPECGGPLTEARPFNLMFKTQWGALEDESGIVYLRPETAQGIFVNFLNILNTKHPRLPFGLAQIGKAFRNEITPGNFIFRTREFEQMEVEYFVRPAEAEKYFNYWVENRFNWYINLGIKKENLRKRPHSKEELAHYAVSCTDIEYKFPFGWAELEGIANRSDFDLKRHAQFSRKELTFFDDTTKERFYPYIIEPSGGVDRSFLAFLIDAYFEEKVKDDIRVVLKLHKSLAPVKIAVFPLLKNRSNLVELAKNIASDLKKSFFTLYDDTAAIGKLYRRQDEIGTPYCITVDVKSLEDKKVTVRHRDTMMQERIGFDSLKEYLRTKFED
ncbi:MAG: glycine--tRNA ligase [Candidatus Omnitrophica bacterium]|nr:glycine--tRNA ligase [Candidatus Omnitrophota bacterium]